VGYLHDLLLVDENAVGLLQDGSHQGMGRRKFPAVPAPDKIKHHAGAQRARAVKGEESRDILEPLGVKLSQVCLHARALELEYAASITLLQQPAGFFIVEREMGAVESYLFACVFLYRIKALLYGRKIPQAQEIYFDEP